MEKFANVSFNPLVSTEYNIVIVPPGRSSLHSGFQVSHVMAKPAEKPLQPKEQNKIYKQFVWAKEPAAHSACYLIQNKIIAVLIITWQIITSRYITKCLQRWGLDVPPELERIKSWLKRIVGLYWGRRGEFEEGWAAEAKLIQCAVVLHHVNPKASRKEPSLLLQSANNSGATSQCPGSCTHTDYRTDWLAAILQYPQRDQ